MATLYGAWLGSPYQARIYCVYTVSYTADHTQAIFAISFGVEFEGSVSDSVNTWAVSGDCGAASGSNVSYSIPSGGGTKIFRSGETAQKYGDAVVTGKIDNVGAVGDGIITGTFTLESGALAPYFTSTAYVASSITPSSFAVTNLLVAANGGTMNNVQVEYNTSASDTGASYYTKGSWATPTITGLTPNRLYYYRVRVSNNTYGYSAWGPWKSFTTLSGLPGAPAESWSISTVEQDQVNVVGITYPDNGGSAIDNMLFRINTTASDVGATDTVAGAPVVAGGVNGLTPGTTYYLRLFAHNVNGWGAGTAWKSFTTKEGGWVNISGVWKPAVCYVCVSPGVWKVALRYVAVANTGPGGGVNWKQ